MTIVKLSKQAIIKALDCATPSMHFFLHTYSQNNIDECPCSPVGAIVRRALSADTTTFQQAWKVCHHATRGGNWFPVRGGDKVEQFARTYTQCCDDLYYGVQPLLVVERYFNTALTDSQVNNIKDAVREAFYNTRRFIWYNMRAIHVDLLDCEPRFAHEVIG